MKFGLKCLYSKTPKIMIRIGLVCKALAAISIPSTFNGNKIATILVIIGIVGAVIVCFFGEERK